MKRFQFFGRLKLWEEVHTDGGPLHKTICEEFEAVDTESAIKKAEKMFDEIVKQYPIDNSQHFAHYRAIKLNNFEADLRIIESVWQKKI